MNELNDDELLAALGIEATSQRKSAHTPLEERIIDGFRDILRFHEAHGRPPQHTQGADVFERLYAVRLERLRNLPEARSLLSGLDSPGLLSTASPAQSDLGDLDEDTLLAQLGVTTSVEPQRDITVLRHVRSSTDRRAAEEIANRIRCEDFEQFATLFEAVKSDLATGVRTTRAIETRAMDEIQQGTFFIIGGQIAFVAAKGQSFTTKYERRDSRLRVIFDNGTESEVLQRSLQRALHRDDLARLVTDPNPGPLFGTTAEPDDIASGTIYVLRSQSDHPFIAENRQLVHKIGVTGGSVEGRIAAAQKDATYLLADVQVVATYTLHNINRTRLERLFHRIFRRAQLDLSIQDRFGVPVKPREWFLVPLHVIDEAVERIRDGSITRYVYDPGRAELVADTE